MDGERLRCPLIFMDAVQRDVREHFQARMFDAASHRPGYRILPRATRDQLADANANWRKPGAVELIVQDAAREELAGRLLRISGSRHECMA